MKLIKILVFRTAELIVVLTLATLINMLGAYIGCINWHDVQPMSLGIMIGWGWAKYIFKLVITPIPQQNSK